MAQLLSLAVFGDLWAASEVWNSQDRKPGARFVLQDPGSELLVVGERVDLEGRPALFAGLREGLWRERP